MIRPKSFVDILIEEPNYAGDQEGWYHHHIYRYPEPVWEIVVIWQLPLRKHFLLPYLFMLFL